MMNHPSNATIAMTPTATPILMPAFAPVLIPVLEFELGVGVVEDVFDADVLDWVWLAAVLTDVDFVCL